MSAFQRQGEIMKELSQMVRDHVFRTVLKKAPKERIEEMLKTVKCYKSVETFRYGADFGFFDLMDLVDGVGLDIGISIRMRDGEEVTFYPGHNFGETGEESGTPHEKRVAKKPYEYENLAHDYCTYPGRNGAAKSAVAGLGLVDQRAGRSPLREGLGGVYAPEDDDDEIGAVVQRIGPVISEHPCDSKKPKIVNLRVVTEDKDGRGEN